MSAYPVSGDLKCWVNGMPFAGVRYRGANVATLKFWIDGMPMAEFTLPANGFFFLLGSPG